MPQPRIGQQSIVAVALAIRLFAERAVSIGKAAKLAQLSIEAFIARLGALGIPAIDYPPEELEEELSAIQSVRP